MIMNNDDYQQIVSLNNQGVAMTLERRDCKSAVALFRFALGRIMFRVAGGCAAEDSDSSLKEQQQQCDTRPQQPLHQHHAEEESIVTDNAFVRGILLLPDPSAYAPDPLVSATVVTSIVMFNMGVALHRQGLQQEPALPSAFDKLAQAESIYCKALHTLGALGVSFGQATGHAVVDLLIMALLNNLAQISFCWRCDYESSQQYLDTLVSFCNSISVAAAPPRDDGGSNAMILECHKLFFLQNAAALQPPTLAAAA